MVALVPIPVPLQRDPKVAGRQQPKWGEDGVAGGLPSKVGNSGVPSETGVRRPGKSPAAGGVGEEGTLTPEGFQLNDIVRENPEFG